jgi:hypothetical protein
MLPKHMVEDTRGESNIGEVCPGTGPAAHLGFD